jgi:nitrous oxide reductase
MRKFILIAVLLGGAWYYFIGGRKLDDQLVREYYQQQVHATLDRNPEALCNQLHTDFSGTESVVIAGQRQSRSLNKDQACEAAHKTYEIIDKIGEKMGGIAQLDYNQEIAGITLSDDKKTATVESSYSLDIAGSVMQMRGSSVDTLVRSNGKVLMLKSDTKSRLLGG